MKPVCKRTRSVSLSLAAICATSLLLGAGGVAQAVTFTTNTSITAANTTYEGQGIVVSGCTVTIDGPHAFNSLTVTNNGVVTHPAPAGATTYSLNLTIAGNVQIDPGSKIDVGGRGYPGGSGPGVGGGAGQTYANPGGGGYGGVGGGGAGGGGWPGGPGGSNTYGSVTQPSDLGSGGGNALYSGGAAGGGAVRLIVSGTLTVNGSVSANGASGGGGGSGGSIWITAGVCAGSGAITANGGAGGSGGGGGGGRIAIYYGSTSLSGTPTAYGTSGNAYGSAGTIFTKATSDSNGSLLIDNGGNTATTQLGTAWLAVGTTPNLTIANKALVQQVTPLTLNSLHVGANAQLTHPAGQNVFQVTIQTDATVDTGGAITADGKGYPAGSGPGVGGGNGAGQTYAGPGGGGYGGVGGGGAGGSGWAGGPGGNTYGSVTQPSDLGSGGGNAMYAGGAAGGGAVRLIVSGTLTVNGSVSANGASGGGGGSGGSIWITAGVCAGSGTITANGGAGGSGGGGGGGRIAIYYGSKSFSGTPTAYGASGNAYGGAGTIFTEATSDPNGSLLIDNGGNSATTQLGTAWLAAGTTPNLTIANWAVVQLLTPLTLNSLHVGAYAALTHPAGQNVFQVTVQTDATVDTGGAITADGQGYPGGHGPGLGGSNDSTHTYGYPGGGGYGGVGGAGTSWEGWPGAGGGHTYGSVTQPSDLGSPGGTTLYAGGALGGGAVRLIVNGTLTVNGSVSANGASGTGSGGSGGSIWITAGQLNGAGIITAYGGGGRVYDAQHWSGSGGGGRIAIYYSVDQLNGTQITASNGTVWIDVIGDIDGDGYVNVGDLQVLVTAWGSYGGAAPSSNWNSAADLNGDGYVNVGDLQWLVANWGKSVH